MNLSQVRFGEVIHNLRSDDYARVVGLKEENGAIRMEIHHTLRQEVDKFDNHGKFVADCHCLWDFDDCEKQNEVEKGEGATLYTVFQAEQEHLDREV